jgi:NAD(P)-dependent dehydrogenase (short-subunit alcohol dehydrogenase family)
LTNGDRPLEGRVAIVTGAGQGIGRAIAERLARDGARVAAFDVNADTARAVASAVAGVAHTTDVSDEASVRKAVEAVVAGEGRIDILVNNAGIYPFVAFDEMTLARWRQVMSVNLDGVFLCSRAVVPHLRTGGYGRIVNISSDTVLLGVPDLTAYIASKAGVVGFTRALANAVGSSGITVNAVLPGLVTSETVLETVEHLFDEVVIPGQAIKRRGQPEDIAECVAYLASPAAAFVTGQSIAVNGGQRFN